MKWTEGIVIFAMAVGTGVSGATESGKEEQELLEMVKGRDRSIQEIVRSETGGETEAERERLKAIVGEVFDYEAFGRLSLGRDWQKRTDAERAEFIDLNRRLVEKNYADPKLYTKAEEINYTGVEIDSTDAVVKTVVHYKSEKSEIDYKLHRVDGKWLIYDMVIDELSVSRSNRSQFRKEIRKSSYEGLIRKLKDKLVKATDDGKGEG